MDNDSPPYVKIFNLITSTKSFMSYKVMCSQDMESLWEHHSANHSGVR